MHAARLVEGVSRRFRTAAAADCLWRWIHGVRRGVVCGVGWQRGIRLGDIGCRSLDGQVGHHELAMCVRALDGSSGLAGWGMMDW